MGYATYTLHVGDIVAFEYNDASRVVKITQIDAKHIAGYDYIAGGFRKFTTDKIENDDIQVVYDVSFNLRNMYSNVELRWLEELGYSLRDFDETTQAKIVRVVDKIPKSQEIQIVDLRFTRYGSDDLYYLVFTLTDKEYLRRLTNLKNKIDKDIELVLGYND